MYLLLDTLLLWVWLGSGERISCWICHGSHHLLNIIGVETYTSLEEAVCEGQDLEMESAADAPTPDLLVEAVGMVLDPMSSITVTHIARIWKRTLSLNPCHLPRSTLEETSLH